MMELGRGFGEYEGHEDGALVNRISALTKEAPESSLAPPTMWGQSKKAQSVHQKTGSCQTLILLAPWS